MEHYVLPEFSTAQEFLCHLARRTGKLKKGIEVDIIVKLLSIL